MKYFKILALVGAIMLTCVNNSEAKAASWEKNEKLGKKLYIR